MTIVEQIKDRIKVCMKARQSSEVTVLRTVLGEIQLRESREAKELTDEDVEKVFRKFKDGSEELLKAVASTSSVASSIKDEIAVYDSFLPQTLSVEEIIALLNADQIKSAKADGPAMGMAMGTLKKAGHKVLGPDVKAAVEKIRSA
jgi:uncharacterized protein YqeY